MSVDKLALSVTLILSLKFANQLYAHQVIILKQELIYVFRIVNLNTNLIRIKHAFQVARKQATILQTFTWTIILTCV